MMKHAYLIMAHTNIEQLKILIDCLDDERNDIYIHIDKKTLWPKVKDRITAEKARIIFIKRIIVNWGGYSQIRCELNLLREAFFSGTDYAYYHLLSGCDLPLKSQNYIHHFFDEHQGEEFIGFSHDSEEETFDRVNYYWLFQDLVGRNTGRIPNILRSLQHSILAFQKTNHLIRQHSVKLYKGANWFSIDNDLVRYLLSKERMIKKEFSFSCCADELFLPSIAIDSPFRDRITNDVLREIDWNRGKPYTYTMLDYDMLINSTGMFGRKFNINTDREIVEAIHQYCKNGTDV